MQESCVDSIIVRVIVREKTQQKLVILVVAQDHQEVRKHPNVI